MNPLPRKSIFLTKALIILTLLLLLGLASEHGHAQARGGGSLVGEVTRVVDGDDVVILDRTRRQHRIRLAGIDAPELNQPHGMASTRALERLAAGRTVLVRVAAIDRHGRTVGVIILDGQDINHQMVLGGHAWHFRSRREDVLGINARYAYAQDQARASRSGLWRMPNPIAPWEWRRASR